MRSCLSFILMLLSLSLLTSCAGYVNSLHNQIDRDMGVHRKKKRRYDQFAQYRSNNPRDPRYQSRNRVGTHNQRVLNPSVKRQYQPKNLVKRRFKADDLNDNTQGGSLWAGKGKNNHLFTLNKDKTNGDIVLINVHSKLKNEMTSELKRAFPDRKKAPAAATKEGDTAAAPPAPAPAQTPEDTADNTKVHDRISSVVIEEVNQDHLLLRGRKSLLYKSRKRLVEVQALVARRDVTDDDTVHSDKILESSINVLR